MRLLPYAYIVRDGTLYRYTYIYVCGVCICTTYRVFTYTNKKHIFHLRLCVFIRDRAFILYCRSLLCAVIVSFFLNIF